MKKVVAIFDIGKTNKKLLLFDKNFELVFRNSIKFDEIVDDDNFPCDDIESIENWIKGEVKRIQEEGVYAIKAINFSTHGATLVYLDKEGKRITPLYNYLKPLDHVDFEDLYQRFDGVGEFSRRTASPAYGMLNAGLQMYWLKYFKPDAWEKVETILHYPQYLSYLFTKNVRADFTSIGAHTAIWDFDKMNYHNWLSVENIDLPKPTNGKQAIMAKVNGESIAIGSGLHDSSASIIPLLDKNDGNEFVLLSTGTWIISMNPFSRETLTQHQLENNCLCFMTPDKQQVKSSMQFLGRIHEAHVEAFSSYFMVDKDTHLHLTLDEAQCVKIHSSRSMIFLDDKIDTQFEVKDFLLSKFENYKSAYYQLIFEISKKVIDAVDLIVDEKSNLKAIYISGGFNRNRIFIQFIKLMRPDIVVKIPKVKNESALGAALLMKDYL